MLIMMAHKVERVEFDFRMSKISKIEPEVWKRNQSKFMYKLDIESIIWMSHLQDGRWHWVLNWLSANKITEES